MLVTGPIGSAHDLIEGLDMLASLRLCSNVPGQFAVQTALGGYQSIDALVAPGGRLYEQRDLAHELLSAIPGITCVKPKGALYLFPKLDVERFGIVDDERFVLDFLQAQNILLVHGRGFNWPDPDHFRMVFLPHKQDLRDAIARLGEFLDGYRQTPAA